MKRLTSIILIAISILTLLSSCSTPQRETKKEIITDSQENWSRYQHGYSMAETEDSVYFKRSGYIFVFDKKTKKCAPLCNKPNCEHEKQGEVSLNNTCNAFVLSYANSCIAAYGDKLYFPSAEEIIDSNGNEITYYKVSRSNLDGSDREDIFSSTELSVNWIKLHRGYIYMNASTFDDDGSSGDDFAAIYRLPLDGGKPEKLKIPHFGDQKYNLFDTRFFGDNMYISFDHYTGDDEDGETVIYAYNLKTGKLNKISDNLNPKTNDLITVLNGHLYYQNENKVYVADTDGKNAKEFFDCKTVTDKYSVFGLANNDGKRLCIVCKKEEWWKSFGDCAMIYLDEKGKAEFFDLPVRSEVYIGGNADFTLSYETKSGSGNDDGKTELYYIDKKNLGKTGCVKSVYTFEDE